MDWAQPIKNYTPHDEQEQKDKELILQCLETFDDILTRNNPVAHMTCSGFVVNGSRDKVLMVYHNIFGSWSWTGGHADGEEDFLSVAIREVMEETGIKNVFPLTLDIVSLDVIPVLGHVKNGAYVSPHLHLCVAYLLQADQNEPLAVKSDENSAVRWIAINEIEHYSNEPHMKKLYDKIINKLNLC